MSPWFSIYFAEGINEESTTIQPIIMAHFIINRGSWLGTQEAATEPKPHKLFPQPFLPLARNLRLNRAHPIACGMPEAYFVRAKKIAFGSDGLQDNIT